MIRIVYRRDEHSVRICGHAGSGEAGHDLVCAAVSILAYTLASFTERMEKSGAATDSTVLLRSGEAVIACTPTETMRAEITRVMDALCEGFAILAENYGANVTYERSGERVNWDLRV